MSKKTEKGEAERIWEAIILAYKRIEKLEKEIQEIKSKIETWDSCDEYE